MNRGCIGIAAIQSGSVTGFPNQSPDTSCYRTEKEAEAHEFKPGQVRAVYAHQGKWILDPGEGTGPIGQNLQPPFRNMSIWGVKSDSDFNYVTKIGGSYIWMNISKNYADKTKQ